MDSWIKAALQERCIQLALYLREGQTAPNLLAEVEQLARDAWAFREEDDA